MVLFPLLREVLGAVDLEREELGFLLELEVLLRLVVDGLPVPMIILMVSRWIFSISLSCSR